MTKLNSSSKYNPVYEFEHIVNGETHLVKLTSVLGHVMGLEIPKQYNDWNPEKVPYEDLFTV